MLDKNKNRFFASTNFNNKTNKIRIFELDDDEVMCGLDMLDLDYVEVLK